MNKKVYVSGHKVPDTDSIASAISYAYLVNSLAKYDARPVRPVSYTHLTLPTNREV